MLIDTTATAHLPGPQNPGECHLYFAEGCHLYIALTTPEQIVDFMESWVDEGAADGFNLFMDVYPEGLETFADQVIPLLQKRGRFRRSYEEKTLRERFGFPRPVRVLSPGARSVASLLQKQPG